MSETQELLRSFVEEQSQEAFGKLVGLYVDFAYSTALRCVNGNVHLAQDIVQCVFRDLAQQAPRLGPNVMLGGWLHRHTWHVASKVLRAEKRRLNREKEAMRIETLHRNAHETFKHIANALDEAIESLSPKEKIPLLLRFFERKDFNSVGASLGISEEAARKRVDRAVQQLHTILIRRGFVLSASTLATVLSTEVVQEHQSGWALQ